MTVIGAPSSMGAYAPGQELAPRAMRDAGLYEEFRARVQPQAEHLRVMDKAGTVFIDRGPADGESFRPEIDRTLLRDLLLASLPAGTVAWGHKLVSTERPGGSVTTLTFADGSAASADLLIGADGAWSRVRPLLSPAIPEYVGLVSRTRSPGTATIRLTK